ncbi:MAG: A/G-specific adenine glycosylase [Alphaproteobacteria bacterium]|nr:A/G-specific adenine glycosylase [Alphaproteobacteria bacterium]
MLPRTRQSNKPKARKTAPAPAKKKAAPAAQTPAAALLAWYARHRRVLPWRALPGQTPDPYAVWLSEIMLQQTTVAAVKPYYSKFLAQWPKVEALAEAPVEEVMRAWAGLGYYSRARNLHACAKMVATSHDGNFPRDEALLRKLPGIGPYTAAAIAAIAFGQRAVVIDGNVERVVARLYRIQTPLPAAKTEIREYAGALTPQDEAGDFAQAMMDLGATTCTPKNPACALCPLTSGCAAFAAGDAASFPRRMPKGERPQRRGAIFYAHRADGALLLRTRPPRGLLGGMCEFPGSEWRVDLDAEQALSAAPLKARWRKLPGAVEHVFTHFALQLDVYVAQLPASARAPLGMRFAGPNEMGKAALPSFMRKVWEKARSSLAG